MLFLFLSENEYLDRHNLIRNWILFSFQAAKLEKWIITDMKGKWNPSLKKEYPVASYVGYRTCSAEHGELANLLRQVKDRCHLVAQGTPDICSFILYLFS